MTSPQVHDLTPQEVSAGLSEGRMLLIDVREPNEVAVEAYPDAVMAPLSAFDPAGLLNPDKGIPTRARCAEYGRMHVRGNLLPHPELPRF